MRTSLTEIQQTEAYLLHQTTQGERLLFEARLVIQPELRDNMHLQQETYRLVKQYGRKKIREEIEAVHRKLFSEPQHKSFREKIAALFSAR